MEISDASETAWLLIVHQVNDVEQLYVHTGGKWPSLMRPRIKPQQLPMTALKKLLNEACVGVQQEDLLREHIPLERRWLQALHLCLNTGNAAYEHARNVLHYLLLPDGSPRLPLPDPEHWPAPAAGSIQKPAWVSLGFDFQAHVERAFGSQLKRPLTKFHGEQIRVIFSEQAQLWEAEPLKYGMEALKQDGQTRVKASDLVLSWEALSDIHSVVNTHPCDLSWTQKAVAQYRIAIST
jgi:hypothetical protein